MKRSSIHIFHRVFHRFWGPKAPFGGVFHGYAPAGTVNCYIFSTDHSLIWSHNKRNQSVLRRFCGVDGLIFVIFVDFCPVNGYLHNAAGGEKMKNQAVYFTNVLHFGASTLYIFQERENRRRPAAKNAAAHVLRRTCAATAGRSSPARPLRRASGDKRRRSRSSPRCPYTGPRAADRP